MKEIYSFFTMLFVLAAVVLLSGCTNFGDINTNKMSESTNDYELSILNISTINIDMDNPDYIAYNSNPGVRKTENTPPEYIPQPFIMVEYQIKNTCSNYIDPMVTSATVVYDNGTQEDNVDSSSVSLSCKYEQISYFNLPNLPNLAPGAVCTFDLIFRSLDKNGNPIMYIPINDGREQDTVKIRIA
jgi:hypothetical protein